MDYFLDSENRGIEIDERLLPMLIITITIINAFDIDDEKRYAY